MWLLHGESVNHVIPTLLMSLILCPYKHHTWSKLKVRACYKTHILQN